MFVLRQINPAVLLRSECRAPVFLAVDSDDMLCCVEEVLLVVGPEDGAWCRIGLKFHPEGQALPFFDVLDWTMTS